MVILQRLNKVPTRAFILGGLIAFIGAMLLDYVNGPIFRSLPALQSASEFVSIALGWGSIYALMALIPISAFRPTNTFSMRGECTLRAENFLLCAGSIVFVLAIVAIQFAKSF